MFRCSQRWMKLFHCSIPGSRCADPLAAAVHSDYLSITPYRFAEPDRVIIDNVGLVHPDDPFAIRATNFLLPLPSCGQWFHGQSVAPHVVRPPIVRIEVQNMPHILGAYPGQSQIPEARHMHRGACAPSTALGA